MATTITRSRIVLNFTERSANHVYFECVDEDAVYATVAFPIWKWQDMGEPRQITMTIEPGDLLNDGD